MPWPGNCEVKLFNCQAIVFRRLGVMPNFIINRLIPITPLGHSSLDMTNKYTRILDSILGQENELTCTKASSIVIKNSHYLLYFIG